MPVTRGATTLAVAVAGATLAACQTAPVQATYSVASGGAGAMRATGSNLYHGAGRAISAPLHDFNVMQEQIAPVLLRAEDHPYDLSGVNSCGDVLDRVSELDLALGPDVDSPKQRRRTRVSRGADFAASAALDAAGSAAEHFIPMRSTLKQITGASRYERHVQHAMLAGETRRSFLKAIGMEHSCTWPAAPLEFRPAQVASLSAPWITPAPGPSPTGGEVLLASARPVAGGGAMLAAGANAQAVRTASAAPRPAFAVSVQDRLDIPPAIQAEPDARQAWRPSEGLAANVVPVSASFSGAAPASGGVASAPWSAAFASSAARP